MCACEDLGASSRLTSAEPCTVFWREWRRRRKTTPLGLPGSSVPVTSKW